MSKTRPEIIKQPESRPFREFLKAKEGINFPEYLGKEEANLLVSVQNFGSDVDYFYRLDRAYRYPLSGHLYSSEPSAEPMLDLCSFVHFQYYFTISCFFRCHLSEAYASLRKAIDATFVAAKTIVDPNAACRYRDRDVNSQEFKSINRTIEDDVSSDSYLKPLVSNLRNTHIACSEFGSHADLKGLRLHRAKWQKDAEKKMSQLRYDYFQVADDREQMRRYYFAILRDFVYILRVFEIYLVKVFNIEDNDWRTGIANIHADIDHHATQTSAELRQSYEAELQSACLL